MPSLITHGLVGAAAGAVVANKSTPSRFWFASVGCAIVADADVIAFRFGIPYGDLFGHRGFFHSFFFAAILSLIVSLLFFRRNRTTFHFFFFLFVAATHPLLDALTSGGLGVALFSPLDTKRYFFPVTPIAVSPIGLKPFFTSRGVTVLISEARWVLLPALGLVAIARSIRMIAVRSSSNSL